MNGLAVLYGMLFQSFLASRTRLAWPLPDVPRVSIILVVSSRPELTLHCLRSLRGFSIPIEIIIVDNVCTGETSYLLGRLDGIKILRRGETPGYIPLVNEAARAAAGEDILLLSDDEEILPGSLESAVRTLESADDIGAVVGKLIFPDGRLEEAGGFFFRDGSCHIYGHGDHPLSGAYMFQRDVDYGSGAFLLTRRNLFLGLRGLDENYDLGHSEDVDIDYCVRLWESGQRVVFDPGSIIVRSEPERSTAAGDAMEFQARQERLSKMHPKWIAARHTGSHLLTLEARATPRPGQRILVLDDRVPHFRHGAGFPRACELIRTLDESGHFVTLYPVTIPEEDWSEVYEDIPRTVEVILGWGEARLEEFVTGRDGYYDQIIISRPHNMRTFRSLFRRDGAWATKARVIYDAEAIFSLREAEHRRMRGEEVTESDVADLLAEEMSLTEGVYSVLSVTDRERDCFLSAGVSRAWTLGHTLAVTPTPRGFEERSGFLFVGALSGPPNRDAVGWFGREIWPKIRSRLGDTVSFSVVGAKPTDDIRALPHVDVLGPVSDLLPYYDRARIFVAPSRLAAGIPIKVQTAAAHGIPIVCTSILADELGWQNGIEILVADDPEEFAACCVRLYCDRGLWQHLRVNALERVSRECSHVAFAATLAQALA